MSQPNPGAGTSPDPERTTLIARSVGTWTGELIDLGGRNTLLYYRDLKQGTLDLSPGSLAADLAVESLLAGRTVRLSDLFDDAARAAAARRARTVKAKADENFEERGLSTMFLAWGMAAWDNPNSAATPAAPVLLRESRLAARGSAGEDFDLALPGEWEINPTLLHLLKTDYQVELDGTELVGLFDDEADPPDASAVFERLIKAASVVPGFAIAPRVVIGNFSYAKLPMVLDLETATDTLVESDLICAIAGDEGARDTVRARHPNVSVSEPDVVAPRDEFLVLDADASQSYAINAAVGGADLVVDGPPGTGKSQTIANLIATLSARGQKVLFVAEKRAAIDAVLDRLNRVGLGELVLDLHEGAGSKRKLAADLSRSLASVAALPRPDMTAAQEMLVRRRDEVVGHADALHCVRDPWGVSVYEVESRLLAIPVEARSSQRLRGETLTRCDAACFRQARADLETFIGLGGSTGADTSRPWGAAFAAATITNPSAAQTALQAASTLQSHTLPDASARFDHMLAECGLRAPATIGAWVEVLQLLDRVSATLAQFQPQVLSLPLADLSAALAPLDHGVLARLGAKIGNGTFRQAKKAAMSVWIGDKPTPHDLHAAIAHAADLQNTWANVATDGGPPRLPADLAGIAGTFGQLAAEVDSLGAWTAHPDVRGWTIPQLSAYLDALLADTQALYKLPELTRLRAALYAAGIWPLTVEIISRNLTIDQALACADFVWLSSILETVSVADARIGAFDGKAHARSVEEYQTADRVHIESAPIRVRRAVAEHATATRDAWPKESEVLEHQAHLKRGHLPVRQLFQVAPHVLAALKPCWAMSPLVVSQLLPAREALRCRHLR